MFGLAWGKRLAVSQAGECNDPVTRLITRKREQCKIADHSSSNLFTRLILMDLLHAIDEHSRPLTCEQDDQAAKQPVVGATRCLADGACSSSKEGYIEGLEEKNLIRETAAYRTYEAIAAKVLAIIASYGVHSKRGDGLWKGFDEFLPMVTSQVRVGAPVRMLLPAFPFKENSKELVFGSLPDLGEELALAHLQGLCDNVSVIYENGAEILICSDGLVYNGK